VSQIGYLAFGLGLFTVAGVAAAVFSMVHHIVVTTALFLASGLIERVGGSSRLTAVGGMVRKAPVLAALFLIPALSVAGIPPLSGFVSKFALIDAGIEARQYLIVGVSLLVSLLTLLSMIRIWGGVFWNPVEEQSFAPASTDGGTAALRRPGMMLSTAAVVVCSLAVAAAAGPLYALSNRTAHDLLDRTDYITEVTRR
jgi:multicomponent Na+:H+ antiporter subunit D